MVDNVNYKVYFFNDLFLIFIFFRLGDFLDCINEIGIICNVIIWNVIWIRDKGFGLFSIFGLGR